MARPLRARPARRLGSFELVFGLPLCELSRVRLSGVPGVVGGLALCDLGECPLGTVDGVGGFLD